MGKCEICHTKTSLEGIHSDKPAEGIEKYYTEQWDGETYEFCSVEHLKAFTK